MINTIFASSTSPKKIAINSDVYFVLPNGYEINFANYQDFYNLEPNLLNASWYWYFDSYGIHLQNADMTITRFMTDNQLSFTLNGTGTSTTKIYTSSLGEPRSIIVDGEAAPINYDELSKTLTIYVMHSSPASIVINWGVGGESAIDELLSTSYLSFEFGGIIPLILFVAAIITAMAGAVTKSLALTTTGIVVAAMLLIGVVVIGLLENAIV